MASLLWIEFRIYGYFHLFQQKKIIILLKNAIKIQKFSELGMLPQSITASKVQEIQPQDLTIPTEKTNTSIVWGHRRGILTLFKSPSCTNLSKRKTKNLFVLGSSHNMQVKKKKGPREWSYMRKIYFHCYQRWST